MRLLQAFRKANNSITLLQKLYFGFGAILLVFSFVTFTYVRQTRAIREDIQSVTVTAETLRLANELEKEAINSETGLRGFQVTEDTTFLEPYYKGVDEFPKEAASLKKLLTTSAQIERLAQAEATYQRWRSEFAEPSIRLQKAALASPAAQPAYNDFLQNAIKKGKGRKIMDSFREQMQVLDDTERKNRDARIEELKNTILYTNILAIILTVICVITGIIVALAVGSIFKRSLGKIADMSQEIARGNFNVKINSYRQDEIGKVTDSLNVMAEQLNESFSNLSRLNKELDQFAYVVSHDLKAPLRAINSLAEWIEDDLPDVDPDIKRNLELMRGRVLRMENLINGILAYARVGRKEMPASTFRVGDLLEEIQDSLSIPNESISIKTKLPELTSQKLLLQQVFTNLVSNAIKYNDKPNPQVQIGCKGREKHYEFYVQDNGPGIPPEYHEKIFGVFQTMEARDTRESTGIGLAIVRKIVLEKGGDIWVKSEEGKGSRFVFTWPKHDIKPTIPAIPASTDQ